MYNGSWQDEQNEMTPSEMTHEHESWPLMKGWARGRLRSPAKPVRTEHTMTVTAHARCPPGWGCTDVLQLKDAGY